MNELFLEQLKRIADMLEQANALMQDWIDCNTEWQTLWHAPANEPLEPTKPITTKTITHKKERPS